MNLIKTNSYSGYLLEDIKGYLSKNEFEKFQKWFYGQTGVIHEGKLLVYKLDYDRFILNLDSLSSVLKDKKCSGFRYSRLRRRKE